MQPCNCATRSMLTGKAPAPLGQRRTLARPNANCADSPAALHAQALGEVAAEHVLAEMPEPALDIDEHLAADVAPAPAEGVILRQVASRLRIHHAVEEAPVEMPLRIVRRPVGHVVELGVSLYQLLDHMA